MHRNDRFSKNRALITTYPYPNGQIRPHGVFFEHPDRATTPAGSVGSRLSGILA